MIVSTGIDIIEVYRIKKTLTRTPRFAERVFTAAEREYCDGKGVGRFQSFAGRFAAKEAFLKALGTGWRGRLKWEEIEVRSDEAGRPYFHLSGEAQRLAAEKDVGRVHLSISHTAEHAIAQVILESTKT